MLEVFLFLYLLIGFVIAIWASNGEMTIGVLFRGVVLWAPIAINAAVWEIASRMRKNG